MPVRKGKRPVCSDIREGEQIARGFVETYPIVCYHYDRDVSGSSTLGRTWQNVVIEDNDVAAGLLVEQSLGMQHFSEDNYEASDGEGLGGLQPYVTGAFRHGGRVFHEIELKAILRDEKFFNVALDGGVE